MSAFGGVGNLATIVAFPTLPAGNPASGGTAGAGKNRKSHLVPRVSYRKLFLKTVIE